jgi:hypothetical protein
MFQKPTVADLRQAAQKLGMNPSDNYLNAVEQIITPLANAYATLDTTPDELPAVKYPRGQFYRPSAEENLHGAWYVKTSIKGKPGGKLSGRRVALKDNVCLAGVPMMVGAQLLEGYVPKVDATVVERILDAGGEIVRILLRVWRQPYEFNRSGAQSAQTRLHLRRIVVRQRGTRRRRRGRYGDRRRPSWLDPHPGEPLRHRRIEANVRSCSLHRHRAA